MDQLRELYRADQLPVFQNKIFATQEDAIACPKGDVVLVQDLNTGLIFNNSFLPHLMTYDVTYQNEQAASPTFRSHLLEVATIVARHFRDLTMIEVGCGKGFFLEFLQKQGFSIVGVDPTYEGANPSIHKGYYTSALGIQADGLILRHVLEHVNDPVSFLAAVRGSNGGDGKVYIEVPCLEWISHNRAWFDIFYEHVNYFRISDFYRMFRRVYESGHIFGGQYLYVVADLDTLQEPRYDESLAFAFPNDFLQSATHFARRLTARRGPQSPSAIWGGGSKGVLFALFMMRAGAEVDFIIDINPAKQGFHLASTGLRVYSPDEAFTYVTPSSDIFVMNRNYLSEIRELTADRCNLVVVDSNILSEC